MNTLKITIAALALGLTATNAQAADDTVTLKVNASELASAEGTKSILKRVRTASRSACDASAFVPRKLIRKCREDIEQQLIAQLDTARLSQVAGNVAGSNANKGA